MTLAVALSVLGASPAVAQSVCGLTATAMAFGNYSAVLGTAVNTTATLTMTCTNNTNAADTVNYSISLATGVGGGYNPRRMTAGAERLNYNIFRNNARTQIWGNGTGGTQVVTGSFNVPRNQTRTRNVTAYGQIISNQDASQGDYVDTVTATATFN